MWVGFFSCNGAVEPWNCGASVSKRKQPGYRPKQKRWGVCELRISAFCWHDPEWGAGITGTQQWKNLFPEGARGLEGEEQVK